MKIQRVQTTSKTFQVDSFIKKFITAYDQSTLQEDNYFPGLMTELKLLSEEMVTALNRGDADSKQEEKDGVRDVAVQGLYHLIKGAIYHPNTNIRTGAETILKSFDIDMIRMSYGMESSMIDTLLEKLNSEKMRPLADSIPGVSQLINSVTIAQKDFFDTTVRYESKKGAIKTIDAPSTVKKKILLQFNSKIVVYLRAMAVVDEPKFGDFCRTAIEMINSCNRA